MAKDLEVAILFADVVGSTQLYETLGDDRARETVAECLEIMKAATEENGGTVIKTMGDEVMATFPTANAAITAAAGLLALALGSCGGDGRPPVGPGPAPLRVLVRSEPIAFLLLIFFQFFLNLFKFRHL